MTTHKTFKREVRSRMAKTGERYTAARRQLTERASRADNPAVVEVARSEVARSAAAEPPQSDEAVRRATGRSLDEWFGLLDAWEAPQHGHTRIARWLVAEHGVAGWWAQSVTVAYERARGMRAKHQTTKGFAISANRTVAASPEAVERAFTDSRRRARWLPGVEMRRRPTRAANTARFDWAADGSRVVVWFVAKDAGKTQVSLSHELLPDAEAAEHMKAFWRERLIALRTLLEGASG